MIIKIIVCLILLSVSLPLGPRAAAAFSTLAPSAQNATIEIKTDRQHCWQRCRHVCGGRPRSSCSFCMRHCKAQSAGALDRGKVFGAALDDTTAGDGNNP
jgi:hypothetical protein